MNQSNDPYVKLAKDTLEHYVKTNRLMNVPEYVTDEMQNRPAGVFVSLKKDGQLRGCIGTIEPVRKSIVEEIMHNAISSGTGDPRFYQVQENELPDLAYSVDVLSEIRPVEDKGLLDAKRFGVVVSKGRKRGLLLPNLEGVDTVDDQIQIACQKAGIRPNEDFKLECFEVIRHQ